MKKDISQQIKEIRNKYNLSQERFARKIGVSGKTISAYENKRCMPPLKVLENISNVYDKPILRIREEKLMDLDIKIKVIHDYLSEVYEIISNSI